MPTAGSRSPARLPRSWGQASPGARSGSTAPPAIVANACSYLASALLLSRIGATEPAPAAGQGHGVWQEGRLGLRESLGESRLRALIRSRSLPNVFNAVLETVFVLSIVRELGIGAGTLGIVPSIGRVGFLIGALLPVRLTHRIGVGSSMVLGIGVVALSDLPSRSRAGPRSP